jgi:hypothetical protein
MSHDQNGTDDTAGHNNGIKFRQRPDLEAMLTDEPVTRRRKKSESKPSNKKGTKGKKRSQKIKANKGKDLGKSEASSYAENEQASTWERESAEALALQDQADMVAADLTGIAPYESFPVESLPPIVREYVANAAAAIGCDPSFVALPLLACVARAIGNRRIVEIKPSWFEPAIIWAAIVGNSGDHKTPALLASTRFGHRYEAVLAERFKDAFTAYRPEKLRFERSLKQWNKSKSEDPPPRPPEEPPHQRFLSTDITVEAVVERLAGQFDGLLLCPDELAGFFGGIAQYKRGKGSDLGFWLAAWSGTPHTVDRKTGTQKTFFIPRASVCLVGGVQPGVLRSAIGTEHLQDGLCARLLLAWPPARPRVWTDAAVDAVTEGAMTELFLQLVSLRPDTEDSGRQRPIALTIAPEARALFKTEFNSRGADMQGSDDDLRAALSKLEAYTARFALIFQLCSWAAKEEHASNNEINASNMERAIVIARWFEGQARRVYQFFSQKHADAEFRELIEIVRRLGGRITVRELQRGSRKYSGSGEASQALETLVEMRIGDWVYDSDDYDERGPRYFELGADGRRRT